MGHFLSKTFKPADVQNLSYENVGARATVSLQFFIIHVAPAWEKEKEKEKKQPMQPSVPPPWHKMKESHQAYQGFHPHLKTNGFVFR